MFEHNNRPRGKESTEVRKSQIKGKESKNSYQELKRSQNDRHTKHTETVSRCFDWHGSLSQSKEIKHFLIQFPCVCVCLSFCDQFLVRVFTFLSLNL